MQDNITDLIIELATLITRKATKQEILEKGWEAKSALQRVWTELGDAVNVVDSMVNAFAKDASWQTGIPIANIPIPSRTPTIGTAKTGAKVKHILDVAKEVSSSGLVETKDVIRQLRAEGDKRPERSMAISVGNTLVRNGWERIGVGKYKMVRQREEGSEKRLI